MSFKRKAEPSTREELAKALRVIQDAVRLKYGESGYSTQSGEGTVFISPSVMEFTNLHGTVVANDVTSIALLLSRRRKW